LPAQEHRYLVSDLFCLLAGTDGKGEHQFWFRRASEAYSSVESRSVIVELSSEVADMERRKALKMMNRLPAAEWGTAPQRYRPRFFVKDHSGPPEDEVNTEQGEAE
jgi:hypothetical protein